MRKFFTSESVTEGHPDKVCDCISDAILDEILKQDPMARVACETTATTDCVTVMGEITTTAKVDYEKVVRNTICDIGYNEDGLGFNGNTCKINNYIHTQSPDIAMGVDKCLEAKNEEEDSFVTGAGDQGLMFGYASDETKELMPLALSLSHKLAKRLTDVRKSKLMPYLRPDGKSQVTVEYEDNKPVRIEAVVISSQHDETVDMNLLRKEIRENVINEVIPSDLIDGDTKVFINPTGRFVIGGPTGDSGLTGRKIIVDTYGGYSRHGGGCFSGKDPTKVDRSASYMCRYIAKNVVKAGLASKCEIQVAYVIGVAKPVSFYINTFGTNKVDEQAILDKLSELVDLRPGAIIEKLDLRKPIYKNHAAYGHMGREELNSPWEKTDLADSLKELLK